MRRPGAFICLVSPSAVSAGRSRRVAAAMAVGPRHAAWHVYRMDLPNWSWIVCFAEPPWDNFTELPVRDIIYVEVSQTCVTAPKHLIKHGHHNYFIFKRNPAVFS